MGVCLRDCGYISTLAHLQMLVNENGRADGSKIVCVRVCQCKYSRTRSSLCPDVSSGGAVLLVGVGPGSGPVVLRRAPVELRQTDPSVVLRRESVGKGLVCVDC